jgi:hypothetical protein
LVLRERENTVKGQVPLSGKQLKSYEQARDMFLSWLDSMCHEPFPPGGFRTEWHGKVCGRCGGDRRLPR